MRKLVYFLVLITIVSASMAADSDIAVSVGVSGTGDELVITFGAIPNPIPKVMITSDSGADLHAGILKPAGGSKRTFLVSYDQVPGDPVQQICFESTQTIDPKCATVVTDPTADVNGAVNVMNKVPQMQQEKSIFASGMVTAASGTTSGSGDFNLNSPDLGKIQNLKSFLQLKRSTAAKGDLKNFEAGLRYSSAVPIETNREAATITAILFDFAGKTEGTASQFGVNNIVGDLKISMQSSVLRVGGGGRAKFRIVSGFEGGSNLDKGSAPVGTGRLFDPLRNVDWIGRGVYGIEGALYYQNSGRAVLPFSRIELNASGVSRHLFLDEVHFNSTTNQLDSTARGERPYAQVDLKLILGQQLGGDYGLKLTFLRGSLPPVFANTKAFQFGFLYESKDRTGE
jgi:hypothetical protein